MWAIWIAAVPAIVFDGVCRSSATVIPSITHPLCRMRIVAADITKIGVESFCNIGDITLANVLVTNRTRDPEKLAVLERIAAKGVTIQYADETP